MRFEHPVPLSRTELEESLAHSNPAVVSAALISAALHDADRGHVEAMVEKFMRHDDPWLRGVAAIAAGHLARIHRALNAERIVPELRKMLDDERTRGKAQDALDDIAQFVRN